MSRLVMITAVTRQERRAATSFVFAAVQSLGGWIEDVQMYSNIMNTIRLVLPAGRFQALADTLSEAGISLDLPPELAQPANPDAERPATLQVTFVHNDPDLRREIPSVPG